MRHLPEVPRVPGQQRAFAHTWFIREWMEQAGYKQADMQRQFGWSKAKASDVFNGQRYNQALIDDLAPWLNARPYELLMHPHDAMAFRRLRQDVVRLAAAHPEQLASVERKAG